eukprot:CAMPEP_0118655246 /NCGR_PEP_ID=MMETSP0785-20121206/12820_1 /TAXON_ID=91992 /ORGANISM="Bolidomonas pacifica, Strain CCMP 1866" /LENGTH=454 /DNA_ID=CAMNT_0006547959 /DNA_START=114 /DNA_END=1479 /DNA_ORIENTATION=+
MADITRQHNTDVPLPRHSSKRNAYPQNADLITSYALETGIFNSAIVQDGRKEDDSVEVDLSGVFFHGEPGLRSQCWNETLITLSYDSSTSSVSSSSEVFSEVDTFVQMITQGGYLVGPAVKGEVDDKKDWVSDVQSSWPPRLIPVEDGNVVVKLPFHDEKDVERALKGTEEGGKVIEVLVAGGGAFGTGEHPTTRMCSAWGYRVVKELAKKGNRKGKKVEVVDYGAGTGLIGLVALAAGEDNVRVRGVEVDNLAIVAGRENGELNGYGRKAFEMYAPPLGAAGGDLWEKLTGVDAIDPVKENVERFEEGDGADVVLANILAGPLKELAPTIWALTKEGGRVGLSGIVNESQSDGVMEVYKQMGFKDVRVEKVDGIWGFLTMRKKGGGKLEGVKLKNIVESLVQELGWDNLAESAGVRAFEREGNPTIKSALKFLRNKDHEWARKRVEKLYEDRI